MAVARFARALSIVVVRPDAHLQAKLYYVGLVKNIAIEFKDKTKVYSSKSDAEIKEQRIQFFFSESKTSRTNREQARSAGIIYRG